MGQHANDIIDGFCDQFGDYTYKDNVKYKDYPETPAEKNIRLVRKELAILIKDKLSKNEQQAVNNARREINIKYGNDWRTRGLISNDDNQWLPLNQYPIQ